MERQKKSNKFISHLAPQISSTNYIKPDISVIGFLKPLLRRINSFPQTQVFQTSITKSHFFSPYLAYQTLYIKPLYQTYPNLSNQPILWYSCLMLYLGYFAQSFLSPAIGKFNNTRRHYEGRNFFPVPGMSVGGGTISPRHYEGAFFFPVPGFFPGDQTTSDTKSLQ